MRKRAGFASAAAAARAFRKMHPQNLRDHEADRRGISPDQAERYARAFGCSACWLLYGEAGAGFGGAPILGYLVAEGAVERHDGGMGEPDEAPRPPEGPDGVSALRVKGDDMWPAYGDGDLLYFSEPVSDPEEIREHLAGKECVVRLEDGRELVRRVDLGVEAGRFTLNGYKTPPIRDVEVVSAALVVWVRKAGV